MADTYPVPTASPLDDIKQWVGLLLAAIDESLDRSDVWPEGEETTALGYVQDLKLWVSLLTNPIYLDRVLATQTANLIACWTLGDTSGTTAVNAQGVSTRDAAYTNGVTLNASTFTDGTPAPSFDGTNDLLNLYSSDLNSVFNFNEGGLMLFMKIDPTLLASSTLAVLAGLSDNAINNGLRPQKAASANSFIFRRKVGGTNEDINVTISSSGWVNLIYNWSHSANKAEAFLNGVSQGSTTCGNITGASLDSAHTLLAASTVSAQNPFKGSLKYVTLWSAPLSSASIAALSTV